MTPPPPTRNAARPLPGSGLPPPELVQHYPEFQRLLRTRINEILSLNAAARENLDQQIMDSPGDDADASVIDVDADYFLNLANAQQRELLELRDALERIERGSFGICEACGDPIPLERLYKQNTARLCVEDQENRERTHRGIRRMS